MSEPDNQHTSASEEMVDIGGYRLRIKCVGQGTPTVVIDGGLGEELDDWASLQEAIAAFTRVCAYDRAGAGKSDPGPKPRTSQQMVNELRTMLTEAQIVGPYVLVGHSLGGLNVQLYAAQYPDEVAGLVLLDPSFSSMMATLEPILGKIWTPLWNSQSASDAEGTTKQDFDTSCAQVAAAGKLTDVPLVVISAGQPVKLPWPISVFFPSAKMLHAMQEGHADLVRASSKGEHLIAENSSHSAIGGDDLVLIVETIRRLVQAAR